MELPSLRAKDMGWLRVVVALAGAFVLFAVMLVLSGRDAGHVLKTLLVGGWGSTTAITESIVKAIPIMFCAFAAALPARLGLINIGGEGQFVLGAIGASWVALSFPELPRPAMLLAMALVAMLAGGLWGLIPGGLRALTRSSEIVVSLLLNYVAVFGLLHLIHGPWKDPNAFGWAQTPAFPPSAVLPHIAGTRIHILLFVGLAVAVVLALLMWRSVWGVAFKIIEASPRAAEYARLDPKKYYIAAFVISGALAALAGFAEVSVIHGRLREGISIGYGYTGFLVAWICSSRFGLIPLVALLLGGFLSGADVLQISAGLPYATINILQGLLFIGVLVGEAKMKGGRGASASTGGWV